MSIPVKRQARVVDELIMGEGVVVHAIDDRRGDESPEVLPRHVDEALAHVQAAEDGLGYRDGGVDVPSWRNYVEII